jgi:chloramphenicol-sensitive protein RarD
MTRETNDHPEEGKGALYAASAYFVWGIAPLYWDRLSDVPPYQIIVHRLLWSAVFVIGLTLIRGRASYIIAAFRMRRLLLRLALTGVLITVNWSIYIWCVATHRLVEASLGYYLTPLVSIGLGVALLGERMSRFRLAAVALAGVAIAAQAATLGHVPWIAPTLALTFGFYGYLRKLAPIDAIDGLTVETLLFLPLTLALVIYWSATGTGAFPSPQLLRDTLLVLAGPVTAIPLAMFAAGARRVRMTTLGFLQYLSPSITLVVATVLMGEPFTRIDAITFACIWAALSLVALDGRFRPSALGSRA